MCGHDKKELKESLDFYVNYAKEDNEPYPEVLDKEYEFVYKFDVEKLMDFYKGVSKPRVKQTEKIITALHELGADLLAVTV